MTTLFIKNSSNRKLSDTTPVDCTYSSIRDTCPDSCELKNAGCYGQNGFAGMHIKRMEKNKPLSKIEAAREEANLIKNSYKKIPSGRNLRLHVSGDSTTIKGTRLLNNACKYWVKNGGNKPWSYTHAWKNVPRKEWSSVSILASIDNIEDAQKANDMGYAPAIVVDKFPSKKAFYLDNSSIKWIPCPNQTKNVTCVNCKLCLNADSLFKRGAGIAFEAHSAKANTIKKRLQVIK